MSYRVKVVLLAIGAVLGLAGGVRHLAHVHQQHHVTEQSQPQP